MADDLSWLDDLHPIFVSHKDEWEEEERRLEGGHEVLSELVSFESETAELFTARKKQATYINFPKAHASTITGQLRVKAPTPGKGLKFGHLGEVRRRSDIESEPSEAELMYYNIDGIGNDGSEMPVWMDDVDTRAQGTGHRWLMVEAPVSPEPRRLRTAQEILSGFRLFAVERSSLTAPNWRIQNGRLEWIIFREPVTEDSTPGDLGYYLLVRKGHESKLLGASFKEGGWWKYDPEKKLLPTSEGHQAWELALAGQIPVWPHYGHKSRGTTKRPAMSRSGTMELGQIAVGLMNIISARDSDYWRACASELFFLGAGPNVMQEIAKQKGNIYKGVPLAEGTLTGEGQRVAIHDGSMGVVVAQVSESIVNAKFAEAREQSYQQITSTPESSGVSKEAGYQEQKAPYLATRAAYRQQSENTLLWFWEQRSGYAAPAGSSEWTRDFNLAPVVDAIDQGLSVLKRSWLRSVTLEKRLVVQAMDERGLMPEEKAERAKIEAELTESGTIPTEPVSPLEEDEEQVAGRRGIKAQGEAAA